MSDICLGIVCPMANESKTVEAFVENVLGYCRGFKSVVLFVILDKASTDNTYGRLLHLQNLYPEINVISAPENKNVVDAYLRGYKEAMDAHCDWILEIDAGFSHQPSDIPQFFEKMEEGYDCVFGSRFCKNGKVEHSPFTRYLISYGGTQLVNFLLKTKLSDMTSGFELFSNKALERVLKEGVHSKGHFFQTEIRVNARNMNIVEVPIHYKSASPGITISVLLDAFKNLLRLTRRRWNGSLPNSREKEIESQKCIDYYIHS